MREKVLYACKIKLTTQSITQKVIRDVKEKIERLHVPKSFAVLPVLIYFGDIDESIIDAEYFYAVINVADLLES